MSDDRNVMDLERRAAQVRAMDTVYLVTEQDGATPKGIFDMVLPCPGLICVGSAG